MLTPAGGRVLAERTFPRFVWLQSWGPLYAILHRIALGEAAESMTAAALMPGGDAGISLVAQAGYPGGGGGRGGDVWVPVDVRAVSRGRTRVRRRARHVARLLRAARRPGSRHRRGPGGLHGQPVAGLHAVGLAPVRDTRRPPGADFRAGRHRAAIRGTPRRARPTPWRRTAPPSPTPAVATSRLPAAGVRLSESLAASHENRAAQSRTLAGELLRRSRKRPHRGGDGRHRDGRAPCPGRQRGHGPRARALPNPKVPTGPGPVEPRGPAVGDGRDHQGPGRRR